MIKVVIVEDNQDLRERMKHFMGKSEKMECVLAVDSIERFMKHHKNVAEINIVLLDIGLPGISGLKALPSIKSLYPEAAIVILTVYKDPDKIFNALCMGASGYLLKNINFNQLEEHLVSMFEEGGAPLSPQIARRVLDYFHTSKLSFGKQKTKLTAKEVQVVRFLVDGFTYQRIAEQLGISIDGVRFHIKNIYKKLQVKSKTQVIKKFINGDI